MQSECRAKLDGTSKISGNEKHLHSQEICAQLNEIRKEQRCRTRVLSPGKCNGWQIFHTRLLSRTLQEKRYEWSGYGQGQESESNSKAISSDFHPASPLPIPALVLTL